MRRPSNRLKKIYEPGRGKAQIIETPKQLAHILWAASRGATGTRNVALLWMLFGSGLRINEAAQLKIKDIFDADGELKESFRLPAIYTKTGNPRVIYLLVRQQREALLALRDQRLNDRVMLSSDDSYGGLAPESPVFLSLKGKSWRTLAFNPKKYPDAEGNIKTTMVCGSLENLVRELIKRAGIEAGSSHSGRRSLASWMDRRGYDLKAIQAVLGHATPDMTLVYIDAWDKRISFAFREACRGLRPPKYEV